MNDYMNNLKKSIIDYANSDKEYGWLEIEHEGKVYKFPKRAVIHAVFGNSYAIAKLMPEYEPFSDIDLKMINDNMFHSDAWIGAGLDIEKAYDYDIPEREVWHKATFEIEKEFKSLCDFDFTILANGIKETHFNASVYDFEPLKENQWSSTHIDCADKPKDNHGQLRCIVIPHAGIEYDLAARNADMIITEAGGKLSHLSTVSREKGKLIIRIDDACEKFPRFTRFWINLDELRLSLSV